MVLEYARPTLPTFRLADRVVIVGGGTRLIVRAADLLASAIDVAVTVTLVALVTEFGAVYLAVVAVVVSDPAPMRVQVAPRAPMSLATVAVIDTVLV
jgi:hypothetical protein